MGLALASTTFYTKAWKPVWKFMEPVVSPHWQASIPVMGNLSLLLASKEKNGRTQDDNKAMEEMKQFCT
jgi:hypothetical protein